jgi:hypothetical protein
VSASRSDPFGPEEIVVLRDMLAFLLNLDDIHGGWTSKIDARQTGFSLHVKFDKRVDVGTTITVANAFEQGTVKLCQVVARVLGQIDAAPVQA